MLTICGEYSERRLSAQTYLPFVSDLERDWRGRQLWIQLTCLQIDGEEEKKYLSLISLDDVCLGKEALRKGRGIKQK